MPVDPSLAFASVRTLGEKLRQGAFTSVELAKFYLKRLETIGPKLNAVVTVTRERALQEAERADADLAGGKDRGPLHGIPYGVKDLLATKGIPTTWGAAPFEEQTFEDDATVVRALADAGAVLCAKLAMVEIAGGFGYDQANASFTGPGLNPWATDRWSGGSSSGPGSAVGGGLVPFAIGSETWGSIVTPAGYCGLSGLRPTYGRVSRHGAMALSWTMDKLGPMCRTADDCGLVLHAIAGQDPDDPTSSPRPYAYDRNEHPPPPFRLATLKDATSSVQDAVKANYERALELLTSKELASLEEVELPGLPYNTVAGTLISCEMASAFQGFVHSGDVWELEAEEDRWGGHASLMIPAVDYINATRIRKHVQVRLDALLARYDAVVTPTLSTVAPPVERPFREYTRGFTSTDVGGAGNAAGVPAITVPSGFGEAGLPTAIQFVGRAFEENRLLAIADAYQRETEWHRKHPEP